MKRLHLVGQRFGKLLVVEDAGTMRLPCGQKVRLWACICDCGLVGYFKTGTLTSGHSKSCGCTHRPMLIARNTKHGLAQQVPEYAVWKTMRQRCSNPNNKFFASYGGRGISVSPEWSSFEVFYSDMGPRPTAKHSIDRIDNDAGYSKANCRWATAKEQRANRSDSVRITITPALKVAA